VCRDGGLDLDGEEERDQDRPRLDAAMMFDEEGGKMKLAEALAERSDCQKRLEEIRNRLASLTRVGRANNRLKIRASSWRKRVASIDVCWSASARSTAPIHRRLSTNSARFRTPSSSVT
jgi:hypothetical protein